jgi:hypothetical protein
LSLEHSHCALQRRIDMEIRGKEVNEVHRSSGDVNTL